MRKDTLGDRMKRYEMEEGGRRMIPLLPIVVRMDGIAFGTFTKGLKKPYDEDFSRCMIEATRFLVEEWHADLGYTQSDEISLYFRNDDPRSQMPFDGRYQKLVGAFASDAAVSFYKGVLKYLPQKAHRNVKFDCRVWQLPNSGEVFNMFSWREGDATTNSLQMLAQSYYSHNELHKKGRDQLHELIHAKGDNWTHHPAFFKRGTYMQRRVVQRLLTPEELLQIPEKHRHLHAGEVTRSEISPIDMPPINHFKKSNDLIDCAESLMKVLCHRAPRSVLG